MKIYKVNEEFFAQKKNAIAYAVEQSLPDWDDGDNMWITSETCWIDVFDCPSKESVVNLLNNPATPKDKQIFPEKFISVRHDMMLSEINNKDAKAKTYIGEGVKG